MSRSPGAIVNIYKVPLPRPRDVFHIHHEPSFQELHDALWADLGREILAGEAAPGREAR
ncbi:MAG: hypothetical protein HYV08_04205 [Deltaproteobacteria bacterium]|nr:hypothetical protein [Deltaproteobacteria bacterium]